MSSQEEAARLVTLEKRGKVAIITLNRADKLNAMNQDLYYRIAVLLREIAEMPEIYITVLTGKGRFFSA
jgi:peroxisomal 3,2-trans-enoyl-CoA isomerase